MEQNDTHLIQYATLFARRVAKRHFWLRDDLIGAAHLGLAKALANPKIPTDFESRRKYVGQAVWNMIRRELQYHYRNAGRQHIPPPKPNPLEEVDARDYHEYLRSKLPKNYRDVFTLICYHGFTAVEVARWLEIRERTVRYRLAWARKYLRRHADGSEAK